MIPGEPDRYADLINPHMKAALCFVALDVLHDLDLGERPSKLAVAERLGVTRSYIYERQPWLERHLAQLDWNAPEAPATGTDATDQEELLRLRVQNAILRYRVEHPGAWSSGEHNTYSPDGLRPFVLQLADDVGVGERLTQSLFAEYVEIPLPTLKDWWSAARASGEPASMEDSDPPTPDAPRGRSMSPEETTASPSPTPEPGADPTGAETTSASTPSATATVAELSLSLEMIEIIKLYNKWDGTLRAFVRHLRDEHDLPYNRGEVTEILHMAAERKLLRRPPPPFRVRGSSLVPPPGVQATGDGKELVIVLDGRRYKLIWQPTMDVGSTAIIGNAIRPNEDTEGVLRSFREGVATTGDIPGFLLLDNKECNKSADLVAGLPAQTTLMHSTLGRPQNKAVIEGMFGLFDEELGEVIAVIDTSSETNLVTSVAEAVTRAWDAGRNGRRRKRDGRSPVERYRQQHTPEEHKAAIERLAAIKRRHDEQSAGNVARCDPEVIAALEDACTRFGFDRDGDLLARLGAFSITAVREAAAIYFAKKTAGRLEPDAGLRYFGGIVRNCQYAIELHLFEVDLVDQLQRSGKLVLDHLERTATSLAELDLAPRVTRIVDELLLVPTPIAQVFWRRHLQNVCADIPVDLCIPLRQHLCRRIRNQFKATVELRQQLLSLVTHALNPDSPVVPAPSGVASPSA